MVPALHRLWDFYDERRRRSRGQLLLDPPLRRLSHVEQEIIALEDRFGRNPRASLKMGIALGQKRAKPEELNAHFERSKRPRPPRVLQRTRIQCSPAATKQA